MKRLWRIVAWLVAATLGLIAIVIAAALIFTHTARFNELLRTEIVSYLTQTYRGQITIDSIEGSVWGSLTLRKLEVHHSGKTIASVAQLRVGYQILPALHNRLVISDINVLNPKLHLVRDPDGQWNLLAAIAKRTPAPPSRSTLTIALQGFSIQRAEFAVTTAPSATYRLIDGNIRGAAEMGPSGQTFTVNTISFSLSGPRMLPIQASGGAEYKEAAQVATITVPRFAVRTSRSQVVLRAKFRDLSEKNVDATISLPALAADDVNSLAPQVNLARDLSGTIHISGRASDLHGTMALSAGDARIEAEAQGDFAKSEPIWKIDSHLIKIDPRKLLRRKDPQELPAGELNASVGARGAGFSPAAVSGTIEGRMAGLGAHGYQLGDLTLIAAVEHQTANLKALLAGPGGHAELSGQVDMAKVPDYNLALSVDHLRPGSLVKTGGIPPADLSLTASIKGTGYQPNAMNSRMQMRLLPSTVRSIRIDSGGIDAQVASGSVRIASASLRATETNLDLNGRLGLNPRDSGLLNYNVEVGQLSPWLDLVGRNGSGSIKVAGRAEGNLKMLRTSGVVVLSAVKVDRNSLGNAHLDYDVSGLGTPFKPRGQVTLRASDLHSGIELRTLQTSVRINSAQALEAAVSAKAEDRLSHPASIRADIAHKPGFTTLNLTQMDLATGHGSWRVNAPAFITQRGDAIEIRRFAAANGRQSIALDGRISPAGPQELTLRIEQLRLADFAGFMPKQVKIAGLASTNVTVRGTAAAPVIAMSANITQLSLADIPQAGMSAHAAYATGRAQADATLLQDSTHSLNANAALPVAVSWARGFEFRPTGDADLHVLSKGLDLAVLKAFGSRQVTGMGGILSLDVAAHGPLQRPVPRGIIRLSGARASITQTKVEVTDGSGEIQFEPGQARLVSLSAKAGDGTLTGGGTVALLPNGLPSQVDLHLMLDRWPAIATHEYNATMAARINATGPFRAINVAGRIEVLQAIVRPNLSVTGGAPRPDETLIVVHRWGERPRHSPAPARSNSGGSLSYRSLAVDMDLVIDRDTWIKTAEFAVELQGDLHVHKASGSTEQPNISGTINTVRGTLVVAGREFNLAHGEIMFTGGHQIDPELLIVAQRRVQKYIVSATVGGTASKPTLTLSSIPELPQADVLSVMMFGKPSNELSGGQQKDLQNQALSMAGSYAASQAGQAIAEALGLSELGVTTSSAGVGFGRYLSKNVYVSASQSTSDMQNRQAEIQYYVTPSVNLDTSASTNYGNEIKLQWHKDY